jgi:hypothetical protein
MEVLAGENNFQAEVSQYGTRFRLDFSKVGRSRGGGLLMLCGRETGGGGERRVLRLCGREGGTASCWPCTSAA